MSTEKENMQAMHAQQKALAGQQQPLSQHVRQALDNYFNNLNGQQPSNVYQLVLEEMEIPLLEAIMEYTSQNQSKAAIMLGISRGTLRKKLKMYNML